MRRFLLPFFLLATASHTFAQYNAGSIPPPASVTPAMLASDAPSDNECLTYDLATLGFIWDTCGGGGGAPADAEYIVAEAHSGLSAEVAPSGANQVPVSSSSTAAAWGTVPDAALTSNYSGVGSCSAGGGVTATVDNAAPTCDAHVMFDNEANTVTADITFSDGSGNSPAAIFTPQTGTSWSIYTNDSNDDLTLESNTASTERVVIDNAGAGVADLLVTGALVVSGTSQSGNYPLAGAGDLVLISDSATGGTWQTMINCTDISGNHLNYTAASNSFSCGSTASPDNGAVRLVRLTSDYTNATTTLSNTALTWTSPGSVSRSGFECILKTRSSATTLGTQLDVNVATAPTSISYRLDWISALGTAPATGGTQAFVNVNANATLVGPTAGLTTNSIWRLTGSIVHTITSTAVTIRARASSAGTVTIDQGSYCAYYVL